MAERWTSNTLKRTTRQAFTTLQRAREREVTYPSLKLTAPIIQESAGHQDIDDAFTAVMQSLSSASTSCMRYYRSAPTTEHNRHDRRFCRRYVTPKLMEKKKMNPLQERDENLQIVVSPGTYSVTAAALGRNKLSQQTHVIKVGKGETAAIDFTI